MPGYIMCNMTDSLHPSGPSNQCCVCFCESLGAHMSPPLLKFYSILKIFVAWIERGRLLIHLSLNDGWGFRDALLFFNTLLQFYATVTATESLSAGAATWRVTEVNDALRTGSFERRKSTSSVSAAGHACSDRASTPPKYPPSTWALTGHLMMPWHGVPPCAFDSVYYD